MAEFLYVNSWLEERLSSRISEINPAAKASSRGKWVKIMDGYEHKWHCNRWIQVFTTLKTHDIHYEYQAGSVCFHIEGKYVQKEYTRSVRELKNKVMREVGDEVIWHPAESWCISCCYRDKVKGNSDEEMLDDLVRILARMVEIFDKNVMDIFNSVKVLPSLILKDYKPVSATDCSAIETCFSEDVSINSLSLKEVFQLPLTIPEYQRIYCWEDSQIKALWQNLIQMQPGCPYHLGNVILQKVDGKYEIVDGQQRLVTLTLILLALGYDAYLPLLGERFLDSEAIRHISNAKAVIESLRLTLRDDSLKNVIVENLVFSVIVIKGMDADLGYTFFSNQNSKGVKLSDYNLLKAHHLRYVSSEPQAKHLSVKWGKLSQVKEGDNLQIANALGKNIYRMRHLLRKDEFNEYGHYVRDEFKTAPVMDDVPPFGERFDYFEPIQGGPHFFAFADRFSTIYKGFALLPQTVLLREHFSTRHRAYEEMAETILFAYFLKFGTEYLSEALFCILIRLAEHRYSKARALEYQVQRFAIETNFVPMIQFSSSPTFFLASALRTTKTDVTDYDIEGGIRREFYKSICLLFAEIKDITVSEIQHRIDYAYK